LVAIGRVNINLTKRLESNNTGMQQCQRGKEHQHATSNPQWIYWGKLIAKVPPEKPDTNSTNGNCDNRAAPAKQLKNPAQPDAHQHTRGA
jgi:hypothetical protein